MIRIVRGPEGQAVFDLEARLPGRGAWVCPAKACLQGLRASAASHVLRGPVALPDYDSLRGNLAERLENKLGNLLSIGLKAGRIAVGSKAVGDALSRDRVSLLLIAADASTRTVAGLRQLADGIPRARLCESSRLGSMLGRKTVALAAVCSRGLSLKIKDTISYLTAIEESPYYLKNTVSSEED